jgi:hypothetical protein
MIVSSMTGTPCLGDFLGAIFVRVFGGRFFGVARFDAFLRAGLAVAFLRFEAFLRVARRFGHGCPLWSMPRRTNFEAIQPSQHYPSATRRATFIDFR